MSLSEDLEQAKRDGLVDIAAARDAEALEAVRIAYLGRSGALKRLRDAFAAVPPEEKRVLGPLFNEVQEALKEAFKNAQSALSGHEQDTPIDVTLPARSRPVGSIHPISQVAIEVEQVFTSMGFEIVDGPHIEEDEYNFGRLNIPADHPARDSQDTFWLRMPDGRAGNLLRTHTSAVQSRVYPKTAPPFRKVVVGKVFRYEEVDATHDNTFTQVEGFVVDKELSLIHI